MKKCDQLTIRELVSPIVHSTGHISSSSVTSYDVKYSQDTNELCRFVDLYPFFFEKGEDGKTLFNRADLNPVYNTLTFIRESNSKITDKELAQMIFSSAHYNKHVIVLPDRLAESAKWTDEPYEEYWLRSRWELADFIGIDISCGWGQLSNYPKSKRYRGNTHKTVDKQQFLMDLD